jgi:hypothetical protein
MAAVQIVRRIGATVSTSGTLTAGQHTPVTAAGGTVTMTLPTPADVGAYLSVEKTDASVNTVAITGNIRGVAATTISLYWQNELLELTSDASGSWWPTSGHKTKAALDAAYFNVLGTASNPVTNASAARPTGLTKVFWQCPTQPTNWIAGDEWINNS